jgi:cytochrome c2
MKLLLTAGQLLALSLVLSIVVGVNFAVWGLRRHPEPPRWTVAAGNTEQGRLLIRSYGCGSCHVVPGVPNASGRVGPPLDRLRTQGYVAGVLPTSPQSLIVWIREPQRVNPDTAMPDLGVSAADARDITAYLLSLEP